MKKYKGSGLKPLFYSEISSSYMLYDIFDDHECIILSHLIKEQFDILPEKIKVERERSYSKKGSLDIFITFMSFEKKYALIIEVKVHDYLSAKDGQIITYYNAVIENGVYDEVYFIYLTQFTKENSFNGIAIPKTIDEAKKGKELIKERFVHLSWEQMHTFLTKHYQILTEEQLLIVSLNRQWILQQCAADLVEYKIDVGERGLEDYFFDIKIDIKIKLPFGSEVGKGTRRIWRIDTSILEEEQLGIVLNVIKKYSESDAVNQTKEYKTEESTLQVAKNFLKQMTQNTEDWKLLWFYTKLFIFADSKSHLKFNGRNDFSITLVIKGKTEISLCRIHTNKTIDFYLKR